MTRGAFAGGKFGGWSVCLDGDDYHCYFRRPGESRETLGVATLAVNMGQPAYLWTPHVQRIIKIISGWFGFVVKFWQVFDPNLVLLTIFIFVRAIYHPK